ncbi:MAG: hypothetical protein M1540_07980 [Candidatus Bathyarchaeota archaeon]|nr:hypothetical protein [Candidatus Bathyarchaeota archaeon]
MCDCAVFAHYPDFVSQPNGFIDEFFVNAEGVEIAELALEMDRVLSKEA